MIRHAIIWGVLSASAIEPQAFESVLRLVGIESTHARKLGPGLLVVPASENPTPAQLASIRTFISGGGDAVVAGSRTIASVLYAPATSTVITVKDVTETAHPERYLRWNPTADVARFPTPADATVALQDQPTHQPLAFFGHLGKGRYLALAAPFDTSSALGTSRYPYFAEYLRRAFDYHPRVVRPAIEAYFDPGFRPDANIPSLVAGWRTAGIRKIYAATWYDFDYARLIDLCHEHGIAVYAWFTLPMLDRKFWEGHEAWQLPRSGWRYSVDMRIPAARAAAFEYVDRSIQRYAWDGLNFAEMNSDSPADAAQVTALHRDVLSRLVQTDREVILTVLDSVHSPVLTKSTGIDTPAVAALGRDFQFTLQLEDAYYLWAKPPDRYLSFGNSMFDVNVVADRDVTDTPLPSALATGTEFLQLLRFASKASGRVGLYSESTVAPQDWEFAGAAMAVDAHISEETSGLRVRTPHTVAVSVKGDWALVPPGDHLVTEPTNLKAISCELVSSHGNEFEYTSPGPCAAAFANPPASFAKVLPAGQHKVSAPEPTWSFSTPKGGEVGLTIHASVAGTNWAKPKSEAAIITLKIDGVYNQDVTLYMGETPHDYRVLLGPLAKGKHRLDYALNAAGVTAPVTASFKAEVVDDPALAHAPVMYLRPDTVGRYSDLPLLSWYEWLDEPAGRTLQFSMIFSNEDGGTDTAALMARWGRTLDIEYVYREQNGKSTFQARSHKETPFAGKFFGQHPVIYDASDNNNFNDSRVGDAPLRVILWPQPFDLSQHSREELADRNPWTYRIMYEELLREGKVEKIGDPRDYLYVEAKIQAVTAAASFLAGGVSSDTGIPRMRIDRNGWVRSALKPGDRAPAELTFKCDAPLRAKPESFCVIEEISKVYFLDQDFHPQSSMLEWRGPAIRLAPGETHVFSLKKGAQ